MQCKCCATENPDDAVFCKACGKRLDGTSVCPECAMTIPADSAFCPYCGVKQNVSVAGMRRDVSSASETAVAADKKPLNAGGLLGCISAWAAAALSMVSLIFVFLTGVVMTRSGIERDRTSENIYYYFGDAYRDADKLLQALTGGNGYTGFSETCLKVCAGLGTVISVLTLIAVCTFSVTCLVLSARRLAGKSDRTGGAFAVAAYLSYVVGAVLLLSLNNCEATYYSAVGYLSVKVALNGATVAGIVLGAVCAAAYTGCAIARRGKKLSGQQSVMRLILCAAGAAVSVVIVILCARPALGVNADDMTGMENASVGVPYLVQLIATLCAGEAAYARALNAEAVAAYSVTAFIMLAFTLISALLVIYGYVKGAARGEGKAPLGASVLLVISAILYTVFSVVASNELLKAVDLIGINGAGSSASEAVKFTHGITVAVSVLSAVALAVSITHTCLMRKYKNNEDK